MREEICFSPISFPPPLPKGAGRALSARPALVSCAIQLERVFPGVMSLERVVFKAVDKAVCIAIGTGPGSDGFDDEGAAGDADQVLVVDSIQFFCWWSWDPFIFAG